MARRRRSGQHGQALPLFAVALLVLVAFAGLAVDLTHDQASQVDAQVAADSAAIASAKVWGAEMGSAPPGPPAASDSAVTTAQTLASLNSVIAAAPPCVVSQTGGVNGTLDVQFYDVADPGCPAAPPGWRRNVEVRIPPAAPVPAGCSPAYACVEVLTSLKVDNPLISAIGSPQTTVSARSVSMTTASNPSVGVVWVWGANDHGEHATGTSGPAGPTVPTATSVTQVAAITAGEDTDYALTLNGDVVDWGLNDSAQLGNGTVSKGGCKCVATPGTVPASKGGPPLSDIAGLSGRQDSVVVRRGDGSAWSWGTNIWGEVGNGGSAQSVSLATPVKAGACGTCGAGLDHLRLVGQGRATTYAVGADGQLYSWGNNQSGQLGIGSADNKKHSLPAVVTGMTDVIAVTGGEAISLALKSDGTVWAWGNDDYGQSGPNGTVKTNTLAPVQVTGLPPIVQIASGWATNYARGVDGSLWAWGLDDAGELGDGKTTGNKANPTPSRVTRASGGVLSRVRFLATGDFTGYALLDDGSVQSWGLNTFGEIGDNTTTQRTAAVPAGGATPLQHVTMLSAGGEHAMAVVSPPGPEAWGSNTNGQLGRGSCCTANPTPGGVASINSVVAVAAGQTHSLAVADDGNVWSWGSNSSGELGNNTLSPSSVPVQVGLTGVVAAAAGANFSAALRSDGTVWAWGSDAWGELGQGGGGPFPRLAMQRTPVQVRGVGGVGFVTGVKAIAAGHDELVMLTGGGDVLAVGANTAGQLGNGTTTTSTTPVTVVAGSCACGGTGRLIGVASIATGAAHVVASTVDGTVFDWGVGTSGQLGDGSAASASSPQLVSGSGTTFRALAVGGGATASYAVVTDGTLRGWGSDAAGELDDGGGANRTTPVTAKGAGGVGTLPSVTDAVGGAAFALARTADGSVWDWGTNANGELGTGTAGAPQLSPQKAAVAGIGQLAAADHVLSLGVSGGSSYSLPATLVG